jgi:elongation factor 1 alpha-like protein
VNWDQDRYDDIVDELKPFLASAGFAAGKTTFVPLAAMDGVNVLNNTDETLKEWYTGPTLIGVLGKTRFSGARPCADSADGVEVPSRPYESPLRIPVSNVFKGQTAVASGVAVSGRLCSGVIQVGGRVRAVPGDEVANVRSECRPLIPGGSY